MGGICSEKEISMKTGMSIAENIDPRYQIECIQLEDDYTQLSNRLQSSDLVFNALHGGMGENGDIQSFMDMYKINYTGSGAKASTLAMDKQITKLIASAENIPTPQWILLRVDNIIGANLIEESDKFTYPVVIKPNGEGSTMGLSIIKDPSAIDIAIEQASEYSNEIIVEEYIPGREITVGILGNKALPIVEIFPNHDIYDYECKYTEGMSRYVVPAEILPELTHQIQQDALKLYKAMGCRHYARVDFRLNPENQYYLLEINTLPGLTLTSLLPKAALATGLDYPSLIETIINIAMVDQ